MFPHERALVKRLKEKPFALIGVNSDDDLKDLRAKNKKENINWRSFWDKNGTIADAYAIRGWPTGVGDTCDRNVTNLGLDASSRKGRRESGDHCGE